MKLEKTYLNLPVKNGAEVRRMRLIIDDRIAREFDIELAEEEPDFWVFLDLTPFQGKEATLAVDGIDQNSPAFDLICQSDMIKGFESLYREKYRPQLHFSSRRGWNNDPNGLVYYKGEYHLFYQHNPYGWKWGNMHWGHAVSTDLLHWTELPIAIYPNRYGDWVYSGSAAVDWNNTSGFRSGEEDVIVAAYTSTGRGECIASSNDRGRTFTDYPGNPVVKHQGRDPKIIWYEPGNHWVMAVYDEYEGKRWIAFYMSRNLKKWEFQSRIEGYYECPEIFELPVDGDMGNRKWVVYAADGAYSIGSFDGKQFVTESGKHRFNYGNCFYASQTFNNIPPEDGRRIQIAWGRTGHPDMPFNQMMNFPVELTLRTTEEGIRMFAKPVRELRSLHRESQKWEMLSIAEGENPLGDVQGELLHIEAEFEVGNAYAFGVTVHGTEIRYEVGQSRLVCRDHHADMKPRNGKISLEIIVDRLSIEIFGNSGQRYMPMAVVMPDDDRSVRLFSEGGATVASRVAVHKLASIWS